MNEVGELAEHYRWLNNDQIAEMLANPESREYVEDEIADVFLFAIIIAYKSDVVDIPSILRRKMAKNAGRYTIDRSKESGRKAPLANADDEES